MSSYRPPYAVGDQVQLSVDGQDRAATVSVVLPTDSTDPVRRWRLICRWCDDGRSVATAIYCGDDGNGPKIRARREAGSRD